MNLEAVLKQYAIARRSVTALERLPRGGWVISFAAKDGPKHVAVDARGLTNSGMCDTLADAAFEAGLRTARMDAREAQEEIEEAERQRRGE